VISILLTLQINSRVPISAVKYTPQVFGGDVLPDAPFRMTLSRYVEP
jgi:hypothetical protein